MADISKIQLPNGTVCNIKSYKTMSIPMGSVDSTSTSTAFTATVDGINELIDGVCVWLTNGVVTSATGYTIDINGLGAKPVYISKAAATASTTQFNLAYTVLLIYNSSRVSGGCWDYVYGYDADTTYSLPKLGCGYTTCSTETATAAKTASLSNYALAMGGIVCVKFTNNVNANATLNINSKGAKNIYYQGAKITDGIIKANDTVVMVYSSAYHIIAIDRTLKSFGSIKVNSTTITADTPQDTLELVAGTNITLTPDAANDKVTINADLSTYAPLASPTFTGTPKAPTATAGTNTTQIATTEFVQTAIDNLPEPMVFKGSLGAGGTITALPVDGSATVGDTYKVIENGTYDSKAAKIGDTFICLTKTSSTNTWELIPSGDEPSGTVTSITIKGTSPIVSSSSSAITTSGTRTISHANSGVTAGTYTKVTVNATGHVTEGANPTTIAGYGITDAKIENGTITLGSNTIAPITSVIDKDETLAWGEEKTIATVGNTDIHLTMPTKPTYTAADVGALPSTTKYAGSSSVGGAATSANKLNTNAGATNRPVYFSGGVPVQCDAPTSGSWFKGVPLISPDGVMEFGKYIDFHKSNDSTADYDLRLQYTGTATGKTITLPGATGTVALLTKESTSYWGMIDGDGATSGWIRTTTNGLLPVQTGNAGSGHSSLGTSSWYFAHAYIDIVHGSLDGTASQAIKLRSSAARTDSTVDTADTTPYQKYWVKIASCYATEQWTDLESLWAVNDVYGNRQGILKVRARVDGTAGTFGNTRTIRWIVADSDIDVNRFAIVCYNNKKPDGTAASGTATVELWWKSTGQYESFSFVLLDETRRTGKQPNDWVLYDTSTYGQAALPTTGNITYSTVATILNSTTGNAATATTATNVKLPRVTADAKSFGQYKVEFKEYSNTSTNTPSSAWYHIISMQGDDAKYGTQLALGMTTNAVYYRNYNNSTWIDWQPLGRFTATPTSGQVVITDGTTGGIKSSGSTIVATPSSKVNSNWSTASDRTTIVTKGWMSYWDGSYNGSASNLTYCNQGAFGTIVTKNTGDYILSHGNLNGTIGNNSPAADVKTFFMTNSVPAGCSSIGYNTAGNEYTLIFGKGVNTAGYGAVLKFGYDSLYPLILRVQNGTWKSTDWEKISAGYADSAGTATNIATEVGNAAGARPVFYAYLGDNTRVVYNTNFTYNPSGNILTVGTISTSAGINANTANSSTAGGLSLYGTNPDQYGVIFRGTSQKGKHGYVTSDWATYFTMNDSGTRGWIFTRNASSPANVASISGAGNAVFNGSVTVGGNAANTSGCRLTYNSTTQSLDFVFA